LLTTPGQLLIDEALPEDLRQPVYDLDSKSTKQLMARIAERYPDKYKDIVQKLMQAGHYAARASGTSISLSGLLPPPDIAARLQAEKRRFREIAGSDDPDKMNKIIVGASKLSESLRKELFERALAEDNPLAIQAKSGARGNANQFQQIVIGDGLVMDAEDNPLPIPILTGYASGLSPLEYLAASFGARRGTVSTKFAVQQSGYYGKQLLQAAHRQVITMDDCGTTNGIEVDAADPDNVGTVLAAPAGKFKAGTMLGADSLKHLEGPIVVRSALTCQAGEGLCAKCAGARETGRLPEIGTTVGHRAAQSVSEKLAQGTLCLAAGTMVRMADWSTREIERIQPGDVVLGADAQGRTFPVRVVRRFDNGLREVVRTEFSYLGAHKDRIYLDSTKDHKINAICMCRECRQEANNGKIQHLPVGHVGAEFFAVLADGPQGTPPVGVVREVTHARCLRKSQISLGHLPTFDIEVDHPDHRFVLANGMVVSNSSKHSGGQVGAGGPSKAGFEFLNQMVQIPKLFPGGAPVAEADGTVQGIEEAPQGGKYVIVDGRKHYVMPDQTPIVSVGDAVEAGDALSDGVPSPADVTRLKGVGEGRRYFTETYQKALKASGIDVSRRNTEVLGRALVNHVKIEDPDGSSDFLPGEIVPYDEAMRRWQPRDDAKELDINLATGKFMEKPTLHYSVGTRITPRVAKKLKERGIGKVLVNERPAPFSPNMVRAMEHATHDPDWQTRLSGSYLGRSMQDSVINARTSDTRSTSYVPALAAGTTFGDTLSREGKF
jgi:DNA-directed RNA polymerase subunit beta'